MLQLRRFRVQRRLRQCVSQRGRIHTHARQLLAHRVVQITRELLTLTVSQFRQFLFQTFLVVDRMDDQAHRLRLAVVIVDQRRGQQHVKPAAVMMHLDRFEILHRLARLQA